MEEQIVQLREELDREREERDYFQLEKGTILISENTQRELQEIKDELKNLEKVIREDERRHQGEIKVLRQKMKHHLYEHQNIISELRANALVSTEIQQKEQHKLETELHKRMKAVKVEIEEINDDYLVKELELKHAEEMTKLRDKLEKQLTETAAVYEEKMTLLLQELDNMRKNEFSEREDKGNSHIDGLILDHNKALSEASELGKDLQQVVDGNDSLKDTKEKIIVKKMSDLKQDHETLKEKFNKLQLEKDELYKTHYIQKVHHKADLTKMQLETKLKALTDSLEKTKAQLQSVLSASNMDQTALCEVINNIECSGSLQDSHTHSLYSFTFITNTASSSVLLASELTFPITHEGITGLNLHRFCRRLAYTNAPALLPR
ncbi:unnamed protein product [Pleuronectes platessa]|uniref:Dynein regulatory complex subunit 4 n=1 Tax=Pleuronectes platessa TaxID=8262 RepID=A0A9N7UTL9_PLEPL|nr:unnamed protein product [Pleuronectes platessa]